MAWEVVFEDLDDFERWIQRVTPIELLANELQSVLELRPDRFVSWEIYSIKYQILVALDLKATLRVTLCLLTPIVELLNHVWLLYEDCTPERQSTTYDSDITSVLGVLLGQVD